MSATCSVSLFLLDDRRQDTAITTAHSKCLIEILKEQKLLMSTLSKIWENNDGCAEQYRCASSLYLMLVYPQCYSIILDRDISAPGHGKDVVGVLNATDKRYIYKLMSNVQLPGSKTFDS